MGEISDSIIDGEDDFYTGEYIGKGVGYPRTKDKSLAWEKNTEVLKNMNKADSDEMEQDLVDAGFDVTEKRELVWGYQLRIVGGAIVNIYINKRGKSKVNLQGKENLKLKEFIEKIITK